jgi:hypothetical protein
MNAVTAGRGALPYQVPARGVIVLDQFERVLGEHLTEVDAAHAAAVRTAVLEALSDHSNGSLLFLLCVTDPYLEELQALFPLAATFEVGVLPDSRQRSGDRGERTTNRPRRLIERSVRRPDPNTLTRPSCPHVVKYSNTEDTEVNSDPREDTVSLGARIEEPCSPCGQASSP